MPNFSKILESLSKLSSDLRGKQFERYCKWFLENDPQYKAQLKKVWLWNDWPDNWGREKGIDLIAQAHDGAVWAIQAKAYDANYYVTKKDMNTFLSESSRKKIAHRLLIATTNKMGHNAKEVIKGQEKKVSVCLLMNLEESSLDWNDLLNQKSSILVPKTPRPHQQKAIDDILYGFTQSNKGQLYMACGTGKTLVGLWVAKQLNSQRTLVLVPSISLVAQLYREWIENAGSFEFDPLFVCSDETVSKKDEDDDKFVIQSSELGFPVTTNAQELNAKLSTNNEKAKIIFSTYHSSPVIVQACGLDSTLIFDIAIADEAHRCAGKASSDFATIVKEDLIRTRRKLFMTATPKIFSDQVKQKTKEYSYEIVSMDDDQLFGPIFHKLLFSDAIRLELLTDYQVLISVMDNATYKEYSDKGRFVTFNDHETDARTLATQILIAKAIRKLQLKKVITFHNKKKSAREFVQSIDKAVQLMPMSEQLDIAYKETIFGEMQQSQRKIVLKGFQDLTEDKIGLIANVKCLSEGIDVPAIDGIVFVDPKGSEIDIVQSVGRAIRKSTDKKIGTIIIPLLVDKIANEEEELEKSCYQVIWKVVKALRAHDDTLAEELDNIRLEIGKQGYRKPTKLSKITIDLPVGIGMDFANVLELKILESLINKCSSSWYYYFGVLEKYKSKHGHCNVPDNFVENPSLGIWVGTQRSRYKKNKMAKNQIDKLTEIGFDWDPLKTQWHKMFTVLMEFKKANGHCDVPITYKDKQLASWVVRQRVVYRSGKLDRSLIEKLNLIGFTWTIEKSKLGPKKLWEIALKELIDFKNHYGHCDVPRKFLENKELANWVGSQRNNYKKGKLSVDRINKLNELGFKWDPFSEVWIEKYYKLKKFKELTGHCNVPDDYPECPELVRWTRKQRTKYRFGKLSQEEIQRLDQIGFDWNPTITEWNNMFAALVAFKNKHGHCGVPDNFAENPSLGIWVGTQRSRYKKNKMDKEQIDKLIEVGFDWDPLKTQWHKMFEMLIKFKNEQGHCNVPQNYPPNNELGIWANSQRARYKKNKMGKNQIDKLTAIGFDWDSKNTEWNKMFAALVAFKSKHGHCNVPDNFIENPSLGIWVGTQRSRYKKNKMTKNQIDKLTEIGFDWDPLKTQWHKMFTVLMEFKKANGHCDVPITYKDKQLASWVVRQRVVYRSGKLDRSLIEKLNLIGFTWTIEKSKLGPKKLWEIALKELIDFKNHYGHCDVPRKFLENKELANWVGSQRNNYKKGKLSVDRINKLNELGFKWDPFSEVWIEKYYKLKKFKELTGHCNVPDDYPECPELVRWTRKQRTKYRFGKLSQEEIQRLDQIGFDWNPTITEWNNMFAALVAFKNKHGHCGVPDNFAENPSLGIWVGTQRSRYKKNKMDKEQIDKLIEVGFDWDPREFLWNKMLAALVEFKKEYGHCNVPKLNKALASWKTSQISMYKKGKMNQSRTQKLQILGVFVDTDI